MSIVPSRRAPASRWLIRAVAAVACAVMLSGCVVYPGGGYYGAYPGYYYGGYYGHPYGGYWR